MPLGILEKLNLEVACHILDLKESLLKLENQKDFYIDCGAWEGWNDAFSSAKNEGNGKKFVLWHQGEEEGAHEFKAIALGYGIAKDKSSLEETKTVGKEVVRFLTSEGFDIEWDEDPDSYLIIDFSKRNQINFDDTKELTLEIEIPDTKELRDIISKKLKLVSEPSYDNEGYMTVLIRLKEGESAFDGIIRSRIDWREIQKYTLYVETETDFYSLMPLWDFCEISMGIGLKKLAKSGIRILEYEKLQAITNKVYYEKLVNEATFNCLSLIAEGLNSKDHEINRNEIGDISTVNSLRNQLEKVFREFNNEIELWEVFSNKFKIGESMKYKNLQEFMNDLNYKIMVSVLNGNLDLKDFY